MAFEARRAVVVANPRAGGGRVGRAWDALCASVRDALGPVRIARTERPGHAAELALEAARDGARTVVSLGGDGTHHEVVNGLARVGDPSLTLAVLPCGTGGDLRRSLRPSGFDAMLRAIPTLTPKPLDLGEARFVTDDGVASRRVFVNVASCGVSGAIDRRVNASSKSLGPLSFLAAAAAALARWEPPRVRVTVDGRALEPLRLSVAAVCNGRYAGGGMCFAPRAQLDDGLLDLALVPDAPLLTSARELPHLYAGTLHRVRRITATRAAEVTVEPLEGEALLDLDGESPGRAPVTFRALPAALQRLG